MSSISISCFAPKPPPILGLMIRICFTGNPTSGASMRRTWNGTWVDEMISSRSSLSHRAMAMCGSIGVCCTWCTRSVCSKTRSAAANPASTSPVSAWMWWTMLWPASWAPSMSGSSWITGAPSTIASFSSKTAGSTS